MTHSYSPEVRFDFPLAHPHRGIPLGNGTLQISAWGNETLCLTIARAGVGDDDCAPGELGENEMRRLLEAGDVNGLRRRIAASRARHSTVGATLELRFADEARPLEGTLGADGSLQIAFESGRVVTVECAMDEEVAWIDGAADARWQLRSSWQENREILEKRGFAAPLEIEIDDGRGLVWEQTAGDGFASASMVRARGPLLFIATAAGETEEAAKAAVTRARGKPDINPIYYWKQFWRTAPRATWPDPPIQHLWNGALFERAQISATRAARPDLLAAFVELLVQNRRDGIHVAPAIPRAWHEFSFEEVRVEGEFIVGASIEGGAVVEARVRNQRGEKLRLHPGASKIVEREMGAGEEWIWRSL